MGKAKTKVTVMRHTRSQWMGDRGLPFEERVRLASIHNLRLQEKEVDESLKGEKMCSVKWFSLMKRANKIRNELIRLDGVPRMGEVS